MLLFSSVQGMMLMATFNPESWSPGRIEMETVFGIRFLLLEKQGKEVHTQGSVKQWSQWALILAPEFACPPKPTNKYYYKAAGLFASETHTALPLLCTALSMRGKEVRRAGECLLLYLCCEYFVYRGNHYAQQAKHSVKIIRRTCHELKMNNC